MKINNKPGARETPMQARRGDTPRPPIGSPENKTLLPIGRGSGGLSRNGCGV